MSGDFVKKDTGQEPETEYEIRGFLLQHFSSETIAHATYLLSFALVGLAVLSLPLGWFTQSIAAFALPVFGGAFIYVVGRTVYWGYLAHAILRVPRSLGERRAQSIGDKHLEVQKGIIDRSLLTLMLLLASDEWVHKAHPRITTFAGFYRTGKWLVILGFLVGIVLFCISLCWHYLVVL